MQLRKILSKHLFQGTRILFYRVISDCFQVLGKPQLKQPALLKGKGLIKIGHDVRFGVERSPYFYNGYIYLESRTTSARIEIGGGCRINNSCCFISAGEGIFIGRNALIGSCVEIYDSDFHDLSPEVRRGGNPNTGKVVLEDNVFVGSHAKILKGVTIGRNSVVAAGAVVARSVPENVVVGGNPAKVIKELTSN